MQASTLFTQTEFACSPPTRRRCGPSPCSRASQGRGGDWQEDRGGRLDLGPPTPFPFQFLLCLTGLPLPLGLLLPPPPARLPEKKRGSRESTGLGLSRAQPLPQGQTPGWEVGAQAWLGPGEGKGKLELGGASEDQDRRVPVR